MLDRDLKVVSANRAFYRTFQVTPEETESRLIYELGDNQWDIPQLRELLEKILPTNSAIDAFEVQHDFPNIGAKTMLLNARKILDRENRDIRLILLGIADISDRKQVEQQHGLTVALEKQMSERTEELEQVHRSLSRDMAERRRLEDQLRQAQKMESIGTLAAGVAHDLNNIFNIIQGYAFVLGGNRQSDDIDESLAAITDTTQRGAAIVQQLLTLARKTEPKLEFVDVNALIQDLSNLFKETFPKSIEVSLDLARCPPRIMADQTQITQVLLNLCINARDAMPDSGRLALKTRLVHCSELQEHGDLTAEEYVSIEVADTGTGMDENVQSRIFEPFFTTKENGHGTGLGLAVVYGIVKSHNGLIQVKSQPMQGTTFHVYFPVASSEE